MSNKEIVVDNAENVKETEETKMPAYMIAESLLNQGEYSIFNLNLEQLIYEKMVLLFEKLQPALLEEEQAIMADESLKAEQRVFFYKNKLTIINDLIKHKRLLLQVEGGLKE